MSEDNRQRYKTICPICSKEFWACASIFQSGFGMLENGAGNCPHCNTHLNLTLDIENNMMIATDFQEWLERRKFSV